MPRHKIYFYSIFSKRVHPVPEEIGMTSARAAMDAHRLGEAVRQTCVEAAVAGYEDASLSGLCHAGAWEAAVSAIRRVDLGAIGDDLLERHTGAWSRFRSAATGDRVLAGYRGTRARLLLQRAAPLLGGHAHSRYQVRCTASRQK
jgi:hypothetical protein